MAKITIVNPYATAEVDIIKECGLDNHDSVERAGYVSPDKKIEAFLETGQLLQNYRAGGEDYEIQGEETDLEADSPEYVEELTKEAENFDNEVMPQFMDKLTANEILADADKSLENASKARKSVKTQPSANEASERLIEALNKVSDGLQRQEEKTTDSAE